ncbi:MAG: class I SAM-dependent methyltransferase [archaeon]
MAKKEYWDKKWEKVDLRRQIADADKHSIGRAIRLCMKKYLGKDIRLLEAGCGLGKWNFWLASDERVKKSAGVDFSDSVRIAERYAKENSYDIDFRKADIRKLPFKDAEFNFVLCLGVLEHFEDPVAPLKELRRVLQKDGVIFVNVLNKGVNRFRKEKIEEHEDLYSPEEFAAVMKRAGFEVLDAYSLDFAASLFEWIKPKEDTMFRPWWSLSYAVKLLSSHLNPLFDRRYGLYSVVVAKK